MARSATRQEAVDPDRATGKTSVRVQVVDHGLGLLLLGLVARYSQHLSENLELVPVAIGSLAATAMAIVLTSRIAHSIGQAISKHRTGDGIPMDCRNPLNSTTAQKKWKDQAWQLAIHLSMGIWEIRLISQNPQWWTNYATVFEPCPGPGVVYDFELQMYYVIQLSLWIWTGISCKWLEERRKDYLEMMVHHVLTVCLVLRSLISNELPIGLMVLACHDISDIFLDLMKMANYLKVEGAHGYYVTEICFVLNTYVSWPYLRLYVFPLHIIWGTRYLYVEMCGVNGTFPDHASAQYGQYMLMALALLHCFWFYLLNRIAYKLVMGNDANKVGDEEYEITMKDGKKRK